MSNGDKKFFRELFIISIINGIIVYLFINLLSGCAGDGQLIRDRQLSEAQQRCEMRKEAGYLYFSKGESCESF